VVSGSHTPTALPPKKELSYPINTMTDRAVLEVLEKRKYLSSTGIHTPDRPGCSIVFIPTTLRQFPEKDGRITLKYIYKSENNDKMHLKLI